ncbi:MAG TPA: tetraacyldisaccharide 4'-kinase [Microvirga sp.]|jgi:tetraacyldisaccharide 4'-kinase|nr:tetraacyldisaccharide 4'-kinase [Microvirga sp.]
MRAPAFWWRPEPTLPARLLGPAARLYGFAASRRLERPGWRAPVPVICIGNFTAGGAGKTPTALAVARVLEALGERPAFLSRGYGGRLPGPLRVTPEHRAAEVGDEPLLLARAAPTFVSRDRPAGARLAAEAGATVIVMDDGLQNPSLVKDLAVAVVDGATGFGNRMPLPAGPLRAPLDRQWPLAHALLVIGGGALGVAAAREAESLGKPVLRGRLEPDAGAAARLQGRRVLAFAGIGRPEKFFDALRACGAAVAAERPFPDHHPFTAAEEADLLAEARAGDLLPVTTEKDAARLPPGALKDAACVLPVALSLDHEAGWRALIEGALARARPVSSGA